MLAISIGIWYLGHYGEANCNNTEKTKQLTAGIVIYMGVNLLMYCNEIIIAIDNGKAFLKTSDFPILIIGIIVNFGPAILYLVGARRNRPAGEQIKVENRWQKMGKLVKKKLEKGKLIEQIADELEEDINVIQKRLKN